MGTFKQDLETKLTDQEMEALGLRSSELYLEIDAAVEMQRKGEPRELDEVIGDLFVLLKGDGDGEEGDYSLFKDGHFELLVELAKAATLKTRSRLKEKRASAREVANQHKSGFAVRPVDCEERKDFRNNQATTHRLDFEQYWPEAHVSSGGIVSSRDLRAEEYQHGHVDLGADPEDETPQQAPKKRGGKKGV